MLAFRRHPFEPAPARCVDPTWPRLHHVKFLRLSVYGAVAGHTSGALASDCGGLAPTKGWPWLRESIKRFGQHLSTTVDEAERTLLLKMLHRKGQHWGLQIPPIEYGIGRPPDMAAGTTQSPKGS
jgi:hypothetical protein